MSQDNRRPRILVADPIPDMGLKMLREFSDVDFFPEIGVEELTEKIPRYDALVVTQTPVTQELLKHGMMLKVVAAAGPRLDDIDVQAANAMGVQVLNAPDANTLAVAEHTLGLLLALARRLPKAALRMKEGNWQSTGLWGTGLAGKTLGIVGFGRVGREVAIRAQAFGMKILVNQSRPTPELNLQEGVAAVDLYDLLKSSDFVTLHIPSRPENKGLIGEREFAIMKPTAFLISTARADVIDQEALLAALDTHKLAGAALDVFEENTLTTRKLTEHELVIATPHIASSTEDAMILAVETVAQKLFDFFDEVEVDTVLPLRVVPLEKVYPHEHVDRKRAERLASRLKNEEHLLNPPIVIETSDGYMVLDGATRTAAQKILNFPHTIVQVIQPEDNLQLHTWYHVIRGVPLEKLMGILRGLPEVVMAKTQADKVTDELFEYGGLCYFQSVDGSTYIVYPATNTNRLDALNTFTNTYIDAGNVSRTLNKNVISLQHEYPDMVGLVVFPEYTVSQVIQSAQSGRVFPAGITRFVIPGRILRLKADLKILISTEMSLRDKNRWLHEFLVERQAKGKIRFYQEPVFLLDE